MTELINNQFININGKLTDIQVAIKAYNHTLKGLTKYNIEHRLELNEYKRIRANRIYAEKGEAYERVKESQKKYINSIDRTAYNKAYYDRKQEKKRLLKEQNNKLIQEQTELLTN